MSFAVKIAITCSVFLTSCTSQRNEFHIFSKFDAETRLHVFRELPIEKQYNVYKFGHSEKHPPELSLAEPLADNGLKVVPLLLARLIETKNDREILGIAFVFGVLEVKEIFSIKSNYIASSIFKKSLEKIKEDDLRRLCLTIVRMDVERNG